MKKSKPFGELFYRSLKKTLLIMRIAVILMILGIVQARANDAYSQKTRLSLNFSDARLVSVLDKIEDESEFFFLYNEKLLDTERKVNIDAKDELISVVLNDLFTGTNIKYTIIDRKIILAPDFLTNEAKPQQHSIKGTVNDENGNPMPGVNIQAEGTTIGVISDVNGKYSINVPNENAVLIFSFVGYNTEKISTSGKTVLDIKLVSTISSLEEVVVIGYGTMKKSDLTGAVVRVDMTGKGEAANVSLLQAMQGSTPGVSIGAGAAAGEEPTLSIRGQTSLSASDEPLVVIDGIIYNGSISDININDVESVDILKDASAAAVYGSKSANGVMLITSKKGNTDKPLFNFNMYAGAQSMTNNPMRVMNSDEYAVRMVDFYYQQDLYGWYATHPTSAAGKPVRPDVTDPVVVAARLRTQEERDNYLAGNSIDWVDEVMKSSAPIHNYDLSVSGKNDRTNYFLSGSYTSQNGIMLNDKFQRTTLHANFENKITDWLKIGLMSSLSIRDYSDIATSLDDARNASPLADMYSDNGTSYPMYLTGEAYMPHPFMPLLETDVDINSNLINTVTAKIDIPKIKGLTYEFNYSRTFLTGKKNDYYPSYTPNGSNYGGSAAKSNMEEKDWIFNNIVTYNRTLADNHKINATLLYSRESRKGEDTFTNAQGFDNEILGFNALELGKIITATSGAWEENSLSYMARAFYSFKNKYLVTGTIRRDGYSGFGANNKFATFPSFSLGWVTSEESFMKNVKWINFLKVRTSVGVNGNQGIGRYSSFSKMGNTAYVYGSTSIVGVYPSNLGNADLGWESTLSYNLGIDYIVLDHRISGAIDLYTSTTSNVLVSRSIPGTTGYLNVWSNIGEIGNKGIELELTTVNIDKPVRWETKFIFSLDRDKINKLYGGTNDQDIGNSWFVGEPISAIYDYKAAGGVWTEEELYNGKITVADFYPGQFRYVDLNKDGQIDANNDRTILGYGVPNYRFGINSSLYYKNFTFSFFINSIRGGNGYYMMNNYANVISANLDVDDTYRRNTTAVRPYWTPDNGVTNSPGIYSTPIVAGGVYESRSFVRIQDISLNYRFNKDFLNTMGMKGLTVYISAKNLYTFTKWSGWDPENVANTPMMKSIIGGINLSF
jgi:TonB-dependent starch-binding outer membrane protein SusC